MVEWTQLIVPALAATGLVFVASSIVHMVLQLHNPDYRKLDTEDAVRAAMNASAPAPGQYIVPHCLDPKEAASPEMMKKFEEGPNAVIWVREPGAMKVGPFLLKWIAYTFLISLVVGYVGRFSLAAGADYLDVFRLVGTVAWIAYAGSEPIDAIWKGKPWKIVFRNLGDSLVYALLTAGAFAWLWPA